MSGIFSIEEQFEKASFIYLILLVFHFEISGKDFNDEHPENNPSIDLTFSVFHFEISGKDFKDEQP